MQPPPSTTSKRSKNAGLTERKKLKIDITIASASVIVTEPQDLQVEWSRAGKSVRTKKHTVDTQIREAKFKDRFMMSSGFKFDVSTQTFLPDISELTLFCEGQKVGTCTVDLAGYIDQKPEVEKVIIKPADDAGSHHALGNHALYGDTEKFPGAFMKFRIGVTSTEKSTSKNLSPTSASTNQLSKRSS